MIFRSHNCNDINKKNINENVIISGWIKSIRDHNGVLFVDLRDHYGTVQVVIRDSSLLDQINSIRIESVIQVFGNVIARNDENINSNIDTGEVEVVGTKINTLSSAQVLPFTINGNSKIPEDLGLEYRYLALRDDTLHGHIILRHQVMQTIRTTLIQEGFLEIHTPILTASSPEGARDFIVPSRLHKGKFYALPQAPQQFKQLLMMSRFDKYFQFAPCFRDEDSRADRSPGEFYQLDMEMAFVNQEDIFKIVEKVLKDVFNQYGKKPLQNRIEQISYDDAMLKYGSDKPDLRNPLIIEDITSFCKGISHEILNNLIKSGAKVRVVKVKNITNSTKSFFDKLQIFAKNNGGKQGIAYIIKKEDKFKGPLVKFLENIEEIWTHLKLSDGDGIFFVIDKKPEKLVGLLRTYLGEALNVIDKSKHILCWIVDFPFYELDDNNEIDFTHNPFSMIQGGEEALNKCNGDKDQLLNLKSYQYDIVCDGVELSSGAIRNHIPELMYKAFEYTGKDRSYVDQHFNGMMKAMKYGCPPHGGIAPGFDRLLMLLTDEINLRQVIPFPLNQNAQDTMMKSPNTVSDKQLQELSIKITKAKEEKS